MDVRIEIEMLGREYEFTRTDVAEIYDAKANNQIALDVVDNVVAEVKRVLNG